MINLQKNELRDQGSVYSIEYPNNATTKVLNDRNKEDCHKVLYSKAS
jgi:hypothetical protein